MIQNLLLLKSKSILYAEDDPINRDQIIRILQMIFDKVYAAKNGEEAYELYQDESPDIILTDIQMPIKDGLTLIKQIRQEDYNTPIILITSFTEKKLLINATNLSIDGYLVKPVNLEKLTIALSQAMKRTHKDEGIVSVGEALYYNPATKKIYHNGVMVELGEKELELLLLLIKNRQKTVTNDEIERNLWPLTTISNSTIKKLVLRLRNKLGTDTIISVRGIGYRLNTRGNKQ